ncbi:uncharacterized protein LOC135370170 [Ornithodoros turicata]|uniref:uncharacterized protein LOC135370170 n=1 Tax=Ornithodoros turicata TaxID=34597 RepID=UPI0031391BB1
MGDTPQIWKAREVEIVLEFFAELKRSSGEDGLHKVPHETMEELCRRLRKKGYFRTVSQVKSKWKSLKKKYHSSLNDVSRDEWDYFDRMDDILSRSEDADNAPVPTVENEDSEDTGEAAADIDAQDDVLAVVRAFVEHYEDRDKKFLKEMRQMNEDFLREQQRQQQEFLTKLQGTVDNVIHNFTANVLSRIGEVVVKSWAENVLHS